MLGNDGQMKRDLFFQQKRWRIAIALLVATYYLLAMLSHPWGGKVLLAGAGMFVLTFLTAAAAIILSGQYKQDSARTMTNRSDTSE